MMKAKSVDGFSNLSSGRKNCTSWTVDDEFKVEQIEIQIL